MKLSPHEKDYLKQFLKDVDYEEINSNEYRSLDGFTFIFKERGEHDLIIIESIRFETTKKYHQKEVVEISENIQVIIEGNKGKINFF